MATAKQPGVSAVIPSFNDKEKVFTLLKSLKKSTYPNLEVIVIVNGSIDTLTQGKKKYQWVKWLDAGRENIGQTGCYNLGFAAAKKQNHILYIDSDVVADKDMVTKLVKTAESNPDIGIVTPMILYLSDKNWVNQAGATVNLITGRVRIGWGAKKDFLAAKEVQNSGTVLLIKREVIEKIGGLTNWFMCYLDPDYCLRAKKAGFITWYEPAAKAYHDQSKDSDIWRPRVLTRAYLLGRNRVLFMRKHGNMLTFPVFLPLILGYYLLESIKYKQPKKIFELTWGTIVGLFYPLNSGNFIPLPSGTDLNYLTAFQKAVNFNSKHTQTVQSFIKPWSILKYLFFTRLAFLLNKPLSYKAKLFFDKSISGVFPDPVFSYLYLYHFIEMDLTNILLKYLKSGMTFLDVGAHIGYFSLLSSFLVGNEGKVYAFEATPRTFQMLKRNLQNQQNALAILKAVWSKRQTVNFFDYGFAYAPCNSFTEGKIAPNILQKLKRKTFKAQTITIDEFCRKQKVKPDFIKIDIESAEYEALTGMKKTLKKYRPIVTIEIGDKGLVNLKDTKDCILLLRKIGYKPYEFNHANGKISKHHIRDSYQNMFGNLLFIPEK